jgi:excisionase family DNA binding protein
MTRRSFFTTFDVSALCEVNPTTVQNWVKEKKLRAFVTPGGHRRIRREDLVSFLKEFGMPIPPELAEGPPMVLIVDDEDGVREMISEVIQAGEEEFEIHTAGNGIEALLKIGERKPDLLVLDIKMPGMDGFQVCERLKGSDGTRNIKIIGISGDPDPTIRERILKCGADLFYTKPLDILGFREACVRLLHG